MKDARNPQPARRRYRKPKVERVSLAADEMTLANCKSPTTGGGKNDPVCKYPTASCKTTFGS